MFAVKHVTDDNGNVLIQDPPIAQFLFQNSKASIIWLIVRLYIGYEWLEAGWHKFTDPAWMETGQGILGFWTRALGERPERQADHRLRLVPHVHPVPGGQRLAPLVRQGDRLR